ncbi:hypothetical protein [Lactiplantibacillus carotarum]|uniref:hypothetical protein n=1 Tax=Lactiplantibacillus carotarum TaxID=2993456 RepID=UPI00298F3C2D|nr:hypothetical protein [Lactiplantibacillus carotarum]
MKSYQNITEYKFKDEFGFRYGWTGNVAVLDVDESCVDLQHSEAIFKKIQEFSGVLKEDSEAVNSEQETDEESNRDDVSNRVSDEAEASADSIANTGNVGTDDDERPIDQKSKFNKLFGKIRETETKMDKTIDAHVSPKIQKFTKIGIKAAVGLTSNVGLIGVGFLEFKGYKNKKSLLRDMDIALIKKFVDDEENGLTAFLNV